MNYITHLNKMLEAFGRDLRLNPKHVSLYMALFKKWNAERFPRWIYIKRKSLMKSAMIGSTTTYHRIIKDLHEFQYLNYQPSHVKNPGSRVQLFTLKDLTVPLERQLKQNGCITMERNRSIVIQHTIYNKQINFYKGFESKIKTILKYVNKEKEPQDFFDWLMKRFTKAQLERGTWNHFLEQYHSEKAIAVQLPNEGYDHLKTLNLKRYDEPL